MGPFFKSVSISSPYLGAHFTRLSLRPCCIPGKNQFNFFIGGSNSNLEKVVSGRDEVVSAIRDITGRDDMEFGEVITMNIWR